ncbi:epimerase [Halarchaeum grantii]|uniref:UDP-glucose 4-epimerase n=1 Tax=Halarchaeum grantii TaxID=1193105 RepID=A0A830EXH1_9EURY|nr:NAD-dependent epimerase/dehydratase family protein [Halarchaeum grantii]GGL39103.1 epimerase [Halarchaeum grantii]
MTDVLVVGGTGLISTGVVRGLVAASHDVTAFTRGERDAEVPQSVAHETGDRNDDARLAELAADVAPDVVIDMVCFTPEQAEAAVEAFGGEITQYVFCSTVDVYARPPERNPVTEDAQRHDADHHVSDYGLNKTRAEDVFFDAHDDGAFATTVLRPWDTYGEGAPLNHTLGNGTYYVDRLRAGKPIVVHGDGTGLLSACHRDDVARGFVGAVANEAAYGEAYNVTGDECITWNQYHRRVAAAIGAPEPELVHVPTDVLVDVAPERTGMLRDHFQFSTLYDNTKAKRDLGFAYTVPLEEGARRTVESLKEEGRIAEWESEPFDDRLVAAWRDATADVREELA